MRCLISQNHNPWFNLATEEYFLKNSNEEIFLLYINEPCIVVGKHQNLYSEINFKYSKINNIKLARRISGGGTVYQDFNNLNFSFIHNFKNLEKINYSKFTLPILESLIHMGIDVKLSDRNDLIINSMKVSGNAMHIYKTRVLSHGTLLFNSNLEHLSESLRNNSTNYFDRSIKSVKSKVANISNYWDSSKTIDKFTTEIFTHVINTSKHSETILIPTTQSEEIAICQLSKNKFESWEWIYGYSPKYIFKNNIHLTESSIPFELVVEHGIITNTQLYASESKYSIYHYAMNIIINAKHDFEIIFQLLNSDYKIKSIQKFDIYEFCYQLF